MGACVALYVPVCAWMCECVCTLVLYMVSINKLPTGPRLHISYTQIPFVSNKCCSVSEVFTQINTAALGDWISLPKVQFCLFSV